MERALRQGEHVLCGANASAEAANDRIASKYALIIIWEQLMIHSREQERESEK
jgi:hypothetical protein